MQLKSAMMVAPGSFTVTSNTGHTIRFESGVEKFVPGIMVGACKKFGAKVTKYFSDTNINYGMAAQMVNSSVHAVPHDPDMDSVEEVTMASVQEEVDASATEAERFTAKENRVRGVMNTLISTADDRAFTADGTPKLAVVNKMLDDFAVTAETRDEVWAKMNRLGEVPADWFADKSLSDDTPAT